MDDLFDRLRTQVERATGPIDPNDVRRSPRARPSRVVNVAAVVLLLAAVVGIVTFSSEPSGQGPAAPLPLAPGPENLGRSVERVEITGVGEATEIEIAFDGPLPAGDAVYIDDITAVEDPDFSFTTQSVDGTVWVCDDRHFGFGPGATGSSIDVLIPSHWVDPEGVRIPDNGLVYSDSIDHVGKIFGCGPYKGYVQYVIWGGAAHDPDDVSVFVEANSIRVVVQTPEGGATVGIDGIEVETPSGWSAEPSTNEHGEVLYLRGDSGAELHIVVRPTPSQALGADEVLSVVSALGDDSAVITEVEGGYALYATLDCPAEPCERVEVFGYNLSLTEFTELSSRL